MGPGYEIETQLKYIRGVANVNGPTMQPSGPTTASTRKTAVLVGLAQGVGLIALVPGGLFELILPIWLIAKGFTFPTHGPGRVAATPA
jgi:hypothetical protein